MTPPGMRAFRALAAIAVCLCAHPPSTWAAPETDARPAPADAQPAVDADAAEPPITAAGVEGDYLRSVHFRIHWRWTHGFIEAVAMQRPPGDPLNNAALQAEVLFTVRWDGSPAEVTLSGERGLSALADLPGGYTGAVRGGADGSSKRHKRTAASDLWRLRDLSQFLSQAGVSGSATSL